MIKRSLQTTILSLLAGAGALLPGSSPAHADPADALKPAGDAENYVTLYFYRPPFYVGWKTPREAAWTTARNHMVAEVYPGNNGLGGGGSESAPGVGASSQGDYEITNHNIGHTNVHVHCNGLDLKTGVTSDDELTGDLEKADLMAGAGPEMLFRNVPGRFYTRKQIEDELPHYLGNSRMNALKIKVSPGACSRMLEFYKGYAQRGLDQTFGGLGAQPRNSEGGGCTVYGTSFLDVAGLLPPEVSQQISQRTCFPMDLIGRPGHPSRASMFEIGLGLTESHFPAPSSTEPRLCVSFPDPQPAYYFVQNLATGKLRAPAGMPLVESGTDGTARIVTLDGTQVPVPQDPIFKRPQHPAPGTTLTELLATHPETHGTARFIGADRSDGCGVDRLGDSQPGVATLSSTIPVLRQIR